MYDIWSLHSSLQGGTDAHQQQLRYAGITCSAAQEDKLQRYTGQVLRSNAQSVAKLMSCSATWQYCNS